VNVEENYCKISVEKASEGFFSGSRRDEILTQVIQHRFESEQIFWMVVNQENVNCLFRLHGSSERRATKVDEKRRNFG
jgi:hypothetical protein